MPKNNTFDEIWDKLKEYKTAVMTLHSGPDGDSLGSCTAMKYVLEKYLNYKVTLISYDNLSENLQSLKISKEVEFGKDILDVNLKNYNVLITLDTGTLNLMGKTKKEFTLPKNMYTINIDHHETNKYYGNLNYVDSQNPSASSILVDFFKHVKIPFDKELSTRLLLGVTTDSGFFTKGDKKRITKSLEDAIFLIENGADYVNDILKPIELGKPWKMKKYEALVLNKAKFIKEKKLCYSSISKEEIKDLNLNLAEVRMGIFVLQDIKGTDVVFVLTETEDQIKGSLRSKDVDVSKIAEKLGGGGHKQAAGIRFYDISLKEAEEKVLKVIDKYI